MKLLKSFFKGLLIFLIIVSLAAIIYVIQWEEEPSELKPPKKEIKQAEPAKETVPKTPKEKPDVSLQKPVKEKSKETAGIEKTPQQRQLAIIIDDIGNDLTPVRELLKINADITFAVMPLCSHSREAAETLHNARREVLLHLPMEPASYPREKPGNGALFTDMNEQELLFQLEKSMASVPHITGVNNHMGSKFMEDEEKLRIVFEKLKKKNLFFVDSRTTPNSKALSVAEKTGLPLVSRKIFLDNSRDYKAIYKILNEIAQDSANGNLSPVIIIGHPYPETIRAIKDATRILQMKGVAIVPVSRLIKNKAPQGSS